MLMLMHMHVTPCPSVAQQAELTVCYNLIRLVVFHPGPQRLGQLDMSAGVLQHP